jgi:hypothetical protein
MMELGGWKSYEMVLRVSTIDVRRNTAERRAKQKLFGSRYRRQAVCGTDHGNFQSELGFESAPSI